MSAFPGPDNPFVYAQFRLGGGWKGVLTVGGVYAAVFGGLIVVSLAADGGGGPSRSPVAQWLPILTVLQLVALFLVGTLRVHNAIRTDITSRMIESHRLMPVPPLAAVVGYVAGGAIVGLALAVINFALGLLCAAAGGTDVGRFLVGNASVAVAAVLVWFVAAHLAFASRFGILLIVAVTFVSLGFGNDETRVIPGLGLLAAAVTGPFERHGSAVGTDAYAVALLAQAAVAAVSCRAAMRLYRSSDAVGMTAPLGLALLGVWTALSVLALGFPDLVYPEHRRYAADVQTQVVATTVVGMLVAVVPVAAACRAARARKALPVLVPAVATVFVAAVPRLSGYLERDPLRPVVPAEDQTAVVTALTLVVVAAFVAAVTLLMHWAHRRRLAAWPLTFLWIIFAWVFPLIAEAIRQAIGTGYDDRHPGPIFSLSPIGALITLWQRPAAERPDGAILAQVLLVGLLTLVYVATSGPAKRPTATPAAA